MKTLASLLFWSLAPALVFLACTKPIKHPYPQPVPPLDGSIPVSTP